MATRKASAPKAVVPKVNQRALIVGIDDYPGAGNDLPSCIKDAKAIAALLQSEPYGFKEIVTYTNEQATIANVTAGLKWLFGDRTSLTANDRLVFYFSGHGYRTQKDGLLRECLCLHDGFLFDTELTQTTQSLPVGILTVILDCCHAGGMEKNFYEVLMAEEKSGKPAETARIKTWFPEGEEFAKTFEAEQLKLPVKPFGGFSLEETLGIPRIIGAIAPMPWMNRSTSHQDLDAQKSAGPAVNGLLITACRADQTASASSSQTQGNSAFTYGLLEALKQLGANASVSSSHLCERVSTILASLKFKQIPVLHEPINAPGLKNKSFITLQPTLEATTPAKSFDPSASIHSTITQSKGEQTMSNVPTPALTLNRPLTEADAKFCSAVMQSCLQLAPTMYHTMNSKDFQTNGTEPIADGKFWGAIIGAAATAIPGIISAISSKDFQTASTEPIAEDKFWTQVISTAIGIVPGIIDAVNGKDFQSEGCFPMTPAVEASTPAPVGTPTTPAVEAPSPASVDASTTPAVAEPAPVSNAVAPVLNGTPPAGTDEKFWPALLAGLIPAVVGAVAP